MFQIKINRSETQHGFHWVNSNLQDHSLTLKANTETLNAWQSDIMEWRSLSVKAKEKLTFYIGRYFQFWDKELLPVSLFLFRGDGAVVTLA